MSMSNVLDIVRRNLIKLRKKNNLTQVELSQKIGYSDKAISRWEKGEVSIGIEVLENLAKLYGVPITYFFEEHLDEQAKTIMEREKNLHLLIMFSLILIVWSIAMLAFFVSKNLSGEYRFRILLWALPLTLYVVRWCLKHYFNNVYFILTSSFCIWFTIVAFFIQFIEYNFWQVFLFGVPVQLTIILIGILNKIRRPKEKKKNFTAEKLESLFTKENDK